MAISQQAMVRLSAIIKNLAKQAAQIDEYNATNKAHKIIENNSLFSVTLFSTQSDCFYPYVKEVENKMDSLSRLLKNNKAELSLMALEKIEFQIQALLIALNANKTMHDDAQVRLDMKISSIKSQQYKKYAQAIIQSSQQLYQKLSEHHEFERRLKNMLTEKEQQLANCKANQNQDFSTQVLTLHQRLGRCRKAISLIERDIEFAEKR